MSGKFSFDNIMKRLIAGVSMRSLLGPTLPNVFVGLHIVQS